MKGLTFHPTELTITLSNGTTKTQKTYMVFAEDFANVWMELYPDEPIPSAFVQEVRIDDRIVPTMFLKYEAGNGGKSYYHPHFEGITRQGDIRTMSVSEAQSLLKASGIPADTKKYLQAVVDGHTNSDIRISKGQYNPPKYGTPTDKAVTTKAPVNMDDIQNRLNNIKM